MKHDFDEQELDMALEGLFEFIRQQNDNQVKMINPTRYRLMLQTAAQLTTLLKKTTSEGELNITVNPTFNLGAITVELDDLTVDDPLAFADLIHRADNFEIYPLTNGKIKLDITFQSVLKTIGKEF